MNDSDLEKVKQSVSIVDLAERYNANPYGGGNLVNTKYNPLRAEKTSSLKLYRDTNSWADFGDGSGGSCIDFIMKADGIDFQEALNKLSSPFQNIDYKPKKAIAKVSKKRKLENEKSKQKYSKNN
jgi:DNA primase